MPGTSRLGPGSRAFVRGSDEPILILRALGSKYWEVERLTKNDGNRTGELMKKTSHQLRKIQAGERFPGASTAPLRQPGQGQPQQEVAIRTTTTTTTTTSTSNGGAQQQQLQQEEHHDVLGIVVSPSAANERSQEGEQIGIEVVAHLGSHQANENSNQTQPPQECHTSHGNSSEEEGGVEFVAANNNSVDEIVMPVPLPVPRAEQGQPANTSNTSQPSQGAQNERGGTAPPVQTRVDDGAGHVVETVLLTNDGESSGDSGDSNLGIGEEQPQEEQPTNTNARTNATNGQLPPGRIYHRTNEDDEMSDMSLDDYFNGMEDFPFLFSDDDDAIDPNSVALANELESRQVYRRQYEAYINRKKKLVEENWTVCIEPPSENGIDIGDRVRENRRDTPRLGIVVAKHPDSVPGTPLWDVLWDGEADVVRALSGRRELRKIYDNRTFSWQIVDGDSTPDDIVEEFEQVGVVGFDFHSAFAHTNVSSENPNYNFPFMRLLMHMWPGKSLIVEFAKKLHHLEDLIVLLYCSTGSWREQLHRLNTAINERNEGRIRSRHLRCVTEHEWWVFWGLIIGAAPCHKGGIRLFDDESVTHRQFSPKINASKGGLNVMSKTRFFDIKEVLPRAFEGDNHGAKWNQIMPLVDGFNKNRRRTVAASSTITLDEAMSAFQPRTTQTSTLPHLSYIKRKPKPLGTEFKVRWLHLLYSYHFADHLIHLIVDCFVPTGCGRHCHRLHALP